MKELISHFVPDMFKKTDASDRQETQSAPSVIDRLKFTNLLSLKSLIALGFVVAVIPLFLAVMYAAFGMQETSALGRTINSQVFEQTKAIRLVLQKTADIERKARLFVLLSDPSLRQPYEQQSYESTRASFKQALSALLKLQLDNKIALLVNELSEKENLIYQQIVGAGDNEPKLPIDEAFQGLRESSASLSREFESHVDHEFNELRQQSESLEQGLLSKGAALLAISFVFILLLLAVLSRSMRQLDAGIRRLGSGELDQPIDVTGPSDMRYLGDRLEWLRTHLIELETSKQQFIHNVAREIEQPLEQIHHGVEQLAQNADGEQQQLAQMLCGNADKLKTVTEELIRYSQLNAKPEAARKQTINMQHMLESVLDGLQPALQSKAISLKKLVRPVEISGINDQLRSIIEQLMANAVKYSPTGGEIRIMLRESGRQLELEIEDEGPGIAPDERARVFEPFYRGKDADSAGPGLGLAIVKEYVTNHQGKVDIIEARQDQHGARVRVQIPLTGKE